jgi:ADP-ribosylglycohydrolase
MRVAPIMVFYHESPHLCEKAFASAEVTHSHMMAKQGAALQATAIDQALALDPGELFSFQQFMNRLLDLRLLAKLQKKIEVVQVLRENYMSCAE